MVFGAKLVDSVDNTLPATGWNAASQYLPAVVGGALIVFFALVDRPSERGPADGDRPPPLHPDRKTRLRSANDESGLPHVEGGGQR